MSTSSSSSSSSVASTFTEGRYPKTSSPNKTTAWGTASASTRVVGDEEFVEWLAARGFAIHDLHEERPGLDPPGAAIHAAAHEGSVKHLRWLADRGANVRQRVASNGLTPMHYAMRSGSFQACVFLFKYGAAADLGHVAGNGRVPLDYARELGHFRLLTWAAQLERGENWTASSPGQPIAEAALCPPPRNLAAEAEADAEVLAAREKREAKKKQMEEAGLDSETFSGYA